MKRSLIATAAVLLCFGLCFAEEGSSKSAGKISGKSSAKSSSKPDTAPGKTGVVTSVDAEAGTLVISRDSDGKPFTFECAAELLKGIKAGDKVNVWYDRSGEKRIATYVEKIGKSDKSEKPATDSKKKKKETETK